MIVVDDKLQARDISASKKIAENLGLEKTTSLIGGLIGDKKEAVVTAIREAGIDLPLDANEELISKVLTENLSTSKKLQYKIAELIHWKATESSGLNDKSSFSNQTGEAGSPEVTVGADPVSAIAGAIGSIFSFLSVPSKKTRQQEQMNKMAQLAILTEQQKRDAEAKKQRVKMWTTVGVVALVLGAGATMLYFATKKG